jgi:hypothetical protein
MFIQLKLIIKRILGYNKLENNQLRITQDHILRTGIFYL